MAGNQPIKDDLILTRGADFIAEYQTAAGDPAIAPGTTARIEITDTADTDAPIITTWTAGNITATSVQFKIESEQTDLVSARTRYRLMVRFGDAPYTDHCWYYGTIKRTQ